MRLDIEWLRTFKAIYEKGTLTGAAEMLFISQPGVSLHLHTLESYTGYKLFERSAKRMVPTERGKVLYNAIFDAVNKLELVEELFHKSAKEDRVTISIGMCFETFQFILEKYIPALPFNVIIKFGEYGQMLHDLESGLLDLIITPQKGNDKVVNYEPFGTERIVMICGSETDTVLIDNLLRKHQNAEAEILLKKQLWYSTSADTEYLKRFWQLNFKHHIDFRPNFIVPNVCSIVRCLSGNQGFSVIPDFLCREELVSGSIRLFWDGDVPIENTLYFGTRKNTIYRDEINTIKNIFKEKERFGELSNVSN
ncbi:DNA-binding transcriptional LysR family regulator [Mucilaginibacter gracilis]|uniref:DNA-binding transcriptional LysR family regulator n=1 Tax=Mucilaginibacter gracilis TaxID=423350 RepID=A0A495J0M4_9SPHI|nr:LysR family transcriptional regulator [Mucilaginibacter gracilis]RKR81864.1 DNA-binding transcriptional LysR family regulator [Mucilaginibacter gracilis]